MTLSPAWMRRGVLLGAALALRLGLALVSEMALPLPSYYTADARWIDQAAAGITAHWAEGRPAPLWGSPSQRLYSVVTATVYRAAGRRPLALKVLNALLCTAAIAAFLAAAALAVPAPAAFAAAWAVALWPTHVFYGSQAFKDGFVLLGAWLALWGAAAVMKEGRRSGAAGIAAGCLLVGLFRPYLLPTLAGVAAVGAAVAAPRGGAPRRRALAAAGVTLACVLAGVAAARLLFNGPLASAGNQGDASGHLRILPATFDDSSHEYIRPYTPRGLAAFRRIRQQADRDYAMKTEGRSIGSQIYYGADFQGWGDVAAFLPKAAFHVLFMPLPGLYPMEGKPARAAAACENLALLVIAGAGLVFAARRARSPEAALLLAFFAAATAGSALLEFDLGSATRHKLLYLPALFPFAFALLARQPVDGGGQPRA